MVYVMSYHICINIYTILWVCKHTEWNISINETIPPDLSLGVVEVSYGHQDCFDFYKCKPGNTKIGNLDSTTMT